MEKPERSFLLNLQAADSDKSLHWLDEYLDAMQTTLGRMDFETLQPCSHQHFLPLIAKEWLPWFERIVDAREQQQMPWSHVAAAFSPVLAREHLIFALEDFKVARWPFGKRMKIINFFNQLMSENISSDPYATNGTACMHSHEQVRRFLKKEYQDATPETARELGKLYNALYNLSAAWYLDFLMGIGAVNYGPYPAGKAQNLFMKTSPDIRPTQVWPQASALPGKRIELFQIYDGVRPFVDLISCHVQYDGDPISGLKKWRLEVDGKPCESIEQVKALTLRLASTANTQWQHLLTLPPEKIIEKGIWIRCYAFKPLCDVLGLDWKPTRKLLDAAKGKSLQDGWDTWRHPKTTKAQTAYWRKIWDPRIDVYPDGKTK